MQDPRIDSRTDPRTDNRIDPDTTSPVTTEEAAEFDAPRANHSNQREVVVQTGIDPTPDSEDLAPEDVDRSHARRTATQYRTQRETTASASLDQSEWEQGPTTTADQAENDSPNTAPLVSEFEISEFRSRQAEDDSPNTALLFSEFEINEFRSRWNNIQAAFVDSPRHSVEQADELVDLVIQRLTTGFADERSSLEKQWDTGDNASTENLRVALQRYRSFFGRLLSAA